MAKWVKTAAIVVIVAGYPFIGTYLIRNGWGKIVLALFAATTLWRGLRAHEPVFRNACIIAAAFLLAGAGIDEAYSVRLIPAFVYLSLAALFGHTLWSPPSLCERLVRLQYPEFKPGIAEYLRQLTWVWFGFFLANTLICALLPVVAAAWVWEWYTGLVVYVLMMVLAIGEYLYRPKRFPGLDIPAPSETIKVMIRQGHKVFGGRAE